MAVDEHTPLLAASSGSVTGPEPVPDPDSASPASGTGAATPVNADTAPKVVEDAGAPSRPKWLVSLFSPANRVLLAAFLTSFSFNFTQVSIFYVFRLMECDVFYGNHPPYEGTGDRCALNEIAAGTARQFTIVGISTTFFGTMNLFITGRQVKKWGPRAALIFQITVPIIRVLTQIIGVVWGGQPGIWIFQLSQIITIFGGPAGYILVVNTIAGEIVPPKERTALFGKLQGCLMLGVAIGFLYGGIVGDKYGVVRPFQVAAVLFSIASIYAATCIPYISPESLSDPKKATGSKGIAAFFEPLRVMLPQKIRLASGRVTKHYGVFFLCTGVYLGELATGYAPMLLQMYATAKFGFNQTDNGFLLSGNGFMRAVFLIFIFPHVISTGRSWYARIYQREAGSNAAASSASSSVPTIAAADSRDSSGNDRGCSEDFRSIIPTQPEQFEVSTELQFEEEPIIPEENPNQDEAAMAFDLFFLRWSLLVDGLITGSAALSSDGWHMYLIAVLLPFASGTAPAAKGVITSMCPASQRADALNAITLVENIARMSTLVVFGQLFAFLVGMGKGHLTFYCNGIMAFIAMGVLLMSHFPYPGSELVDENELEDENEPLLSSPPASTSTT